MEATRRDLEESHSRYNALREDALGSKLAHNAESSELKHELKKKESELEELKHQH